MKIVLDAMGGDYAPKIIIDGVFKALKKFEDIDFILTGNEKVIKGFLPEDNSRISIIDCKEIIENNESPTVAIKEKKDSSLVVAFDILKKGDADALITAGSTGATLAGSFLKIGRINGVSRPGLAPFLPTAINGKKVILIDCGANMDCKSINLVHFAIMGSCYAKIALGVKNPKVGLLNVGVEEHKGNDLTKEAYDLIKKLNINFAGNIEAREIISGEIDVVVCDGFSGNVALKSIEGTGQMIINDVKNAFKGFLGKIAGLLVLKKLKQIKTKMDYNYISGALVLGCSKIIIKSHGSSKADTIFASIEQAKKLFDADILSQIKEEIKINEVQ